MLKKILSSKFGRDLSFSYISKFLIIGFGFVQLYLINIFFGIEMYGQLAILISTAGVFSSLLTPRSSESVTRFFKREEDKKKFKNAKFVLFTGMLFDFVLGLLLVLLIYVCSDLIVVNFLKNRLLSNEIIFYSFITFFVFLRGTLTGVFQSKEMFYQINNISLVEAILNILFIGVIILYVKDFTLINLVYAFLCTSVVTYFISLVILLKIYFKQYSDIKFEFNSCLFKEYCYYNLKTFLSSSLKAGNQNVDNLILGYFLNSAVVGIYQTIKKIITPMLMISQPLTSLVYPKLIKYYEEGSKDDFMKIIFRASKYLLFIGSGYLIISGAFLELIFDLMQIEYQTVYLFYFGLIALISLQSVLMWWVRIFSNTVNPNYSLYMNLVAVLFQLIITIQLVRGFHLPGLLVSLLCLNFIVFSFWIKKIKKYVTSTL